MLNWKKWFWPGIVSTALLTVLSGWFLSAPVEADLAQRSAGALKDAGSAWASVSFSGRDATLSGVAEGDGEQAAAARTVLETYGVRIVSNNATLPAKADPFTFSAIKDAAGVTLKGNYAQSKAHADFIASVEKAMPGIAVKDEMTLAAGVPDGFNELSTYAIGQLVELTGGEVALSNKDYSIKGDPVDLAAYDQLKSALAAAPPAGGVLKKADISIPNLGAPYTFLATIDKGALKIEGFAPSDAAKAALEAKAKELFPDSSIDLKLAGGAPDGFADLAAFGLGQLKQLGNGSLSVVDLDYTLKGTPVDQATADNLKAAAATLPGNGHLAGLELDQVAVAPAVPAPAAPAETAAPVAPTVPAEPAASAVAVVADKPFIWTATSDGSRVALVGDAASEDSANALLLMVKDRFTNVGLSNGQTVREGAPGGFADAQSKLLELLSILKTGKVSLENGKATVSGSVPSQALIDSLSEKAESLLPQGYDLAFDIKIADPAQAAAPVELATDTKVCIDQVKTLLGGGEIHFASGSAEIDKASIAILDQIGAALKTCPAAQIEIGGHTDAEGDDAGNLILSDKRAASVRTYLGNMLGSADRLLTTGYGETRPVAPNDTPENMAKNRRIEFQAIQ